MRFNILLCIFGLTGLFSCNTSKNLFILSGQSNMAAMDPQESFLPILQQKLGKRNVIVVKSATSGQPIRRWYKNWEKFDLNLSNHMPDLYDTLLVKIHSGLEEKKIKTVTFIWMQGERDAREQLGNYYETSLLGLYDQLCNDLNRQDINFVIGRLSDFDLQNEKYPHWTIVREKQVKVAESNPRFDWVNTDDLNDGYNRRGKPIQNDLHMSAKGYKIMGERFAEKSLQLIKKNE